MTVRWLAMPTRTRLPSAPSEKAPQRIGQRLDVDDLTLATVFPSSGTRRGRSASTNPFTRPFTAATNPGWMSRPTSPSPEREPGTTRKLGRCGRRGSLAKLRVREPFAWSLPVRRRRRTRGIGARADRALGLGCSRGSGARRRGRCPDRRTSRRARRARGTARTAPPSCGPPARPRAMITAPTSTPGEQRDEDRRRDGASRGTGPSRRRA